ncbi:hypothetical protein [Falsochrobactrum tianjinense]|nr:hypothetical protein [Falsochrobactrum sp. TDYN1]
MSTRTAGFEKRKKKKAAREEDARPDLEYGWEEECRIRIEFWEEE